MKSLDFFNGARNIGGRTLSEILAFSDEDLEDHHDIVQWCFPSHQPSNFNPDAPVVSREEQALLAGNPATRQRMREVLERWLHFYGFQFNGKHVAPAADFESKSRHWNRPVDHNHLRITRIIRSLRLFGLVTEAQQVFNAFDTFARSDRSRIAPTALTYWSKALNGELFALI